MIISAVVAASENNAIGFKGDLLWRLPKDMKFFKDVTAGHCVLMGRKSWEALPPKFRPLPDRINIVITRQKDFHDKGCVVFSSIDDGIQYAKSAGEKELMILGGGEIYRQALHETDKVYLTRVHHVFEEADTFFPELPVTEWKETSRQKNYADEQHKYDFDFVVYERIRK